MGSTFPLLRSIALKKSPVNMVNIVKHVSEKKYSHADIEEF
jgi:hypothetical protein